MLKVFLIRHAESSLNKKEKYQGSDLDSELTDKGIEQTKKLALYLKKKNIREVYTSDLMRSSQTAKILAEILNVRIKTDSDLRELKFGDWINCENPLKKWIEYYNSEKARGIPRENIRPPNGENSWDHLRRVQRFLEKIKIKEGAIAIVAHSGTNKVFIGILNNLDPDNFYSIKQENACINEITFDDGKWTINKVNDTSHLI